MANHNLSQLIGALGAWIEVHRDQIARSDLSAATSLILDGRLIGIALAATDAPVLYELNAAETRVVERARSWALAQPESAGSRDPADDPSRRLIAMMRESAAAREAAAARIAQSADVAGAEQATSGADAGTPSRSAVEKTAVEEARVEVAANDDAAALPDVEAVVEPQDESTKHGIDNRQAAADLPAVDQVTPPPATALGELASTKKSDGSDGGHATSGADERPPAKAGVEQSMQNLGAPGAPANNTAKAAKPGHFGTVVGPERVKARRAAAASPVESLRLTPEYLDAPGIEPDRNPSGDVARPDPASPSTQPARPATPFPRRQDRAPERVSDLLSANGDAPGRGAPTAVRPSSENTAVPPAGISWRRFEEYFWWALCFVALVILAWRHLL